MAYDSKVVLITGASRGIGAATAELFSKNGYSVAINYCSSRDHAFDVKERILSIGGDAECYRADVSSMDDAVGMVDSVTKRFGKIDVLVNNAGVAQQKLFTDISSDEWERMFAVNVTGTFNCTKAVLPQMINRKRGKIVNISSIWGLTGASCEVHYSASKAAVIGMTKALAKEVGPSGIQVNCVAPGVVSTEMNCNLSSDDYAAICDETPLGRIGSEHDIAEAILFFASNRSDFCTGQIFSPNGGIVI